MWGKYHFKTFDGDVYQFPGMCEYNLVSDCHSSFQDFSVHVKKTFANGHISVSRVFVTIKDLVIDLRKDLVLVGGELVAVPYHVSGVLVERNTIYTKLSYKLGFSVTWNKEEAVMVELDSKYANRTCGLCGDFNGVPVFDEFISQGRKIGAIEYGNKHKIHNPNEDCEDPYEEEQEDLSFHMCAGFRESCGQLLQSGDWASCAGVLSPEPYIKACAIDKCQQQPGDTMDESSICATLAEYSRQCSHATGIPPNWRNASFCAVECPFNMVYLESGSPCMDTCSHTESNSLCEDHNVDGCFCPDGTVFDDLSKKGCIPKEQCQCKHDKIYNVGEVLLTDTEECLCHEGKWSCKSLSTPASCAVEEGSHFTTYDGKTYSFHGNCYYVLSKDCMGSKFSILGQLIPCSSQEWDTCLKTVVVRMHGDKRNELIIKADGKVIHNAAVNLPYSTADFTVFQPSSFHIVLQTHFGLQLQIQLVPVMQVYITLEHSFKTLTCGLCGNYNMVLFDDLMSPQGVVESTAASFGNSWRAQASCPDSLDRLGDPCSLSVDNENFAEHWCSLLKNTESVFSKCHAAVNPDIHYKRCKYASCSCEKSEDCMCAVVSSYVRACSAKGVFLPGWRTTVCKKYTDDCPASQTFSYRLQNCQHTCRSLSLDRQSCSTDFLPVEGCSCPDDLYLDDSGTCVPISRCPCFHNGEHIKPGKSINIKDEHCICTNGKLHCKSWKPLPRGCSPPKVYFNCSMAGPSENGLECAQTCMHLEDDCFPSECVSGCQCPAGLLDDGRGHCVKDYDCPCQHDGHFYKAGSKILIQCNTCTCKRGRWSCTNIECPRTCTIYGSGHYKTFDGMQFDFSGECTYVADECGRNSSNFYVITENVPCGTTGTTCSKTVKIVLGRKELTLTDNTYVEKDLPSGPDIKYRVRSVGLYLVIESNIGVAAFWDRRTTVRIILQPQHMGNVCGLCGNFNGNGMDDFTTHSQLQVSDVLEFANSWKVFSGCPDAESNFNPCSERPNRQTWAKMQCSIIIGDTFKTCHKKVPPIPYFENCVQDACACDSGGDCECFCTAVAAYAQACNEANVCVTWRTPDICPVFCDFYNAPYECKWHYSPCHTPCYKTCLNPMGNCNSTLPNLEGCYPVCPDDKPIFDEKTQTCVEECNNTCIINGIEYEPGENVPTDNEICSTTTPQPLTSTSAMASTSSVTPTIPEISIITTTTTEETTSQTSSVISTPITIITTPCIPWCEWSKWYNVDNPASKNDDNETYSNIKAHGEDICTKPEEIKCRAAMEPSISFEDFISETQQVVVCNVSLGLLCEKNKQTRPPKKCFDYEIQVYCCYPCGPEGTSTGPPTEQPSTEKTTTPTITPGVVETTTKSPVTKETSTITGSPVVEETTTSPPGTSSTEIPATTRPPTESPSTEKTTTPTITPGVVETTTSPPETSSTEIPATTRPPTEPPSTEKTTTPTITP
uniref:VWFD domain-containing protein n=1 Tax=Denticeps clupeoides TaxID=299321 RepID=A0AAY4DDD1_9TELE